MDELARCGEKLAADVRAGILDQGLGRVPELIAIVEDNDLGMEGSLGDGCGSGKKFKKCCGAAA